MVRLNLREEIDSSAPVFALLLAAKTFFFRVRFTAGEPGAFGLEALELLKCSDDLGRLELISAV